MLAGVGDEPMPCRTSQPGSLHCSSDSPSPLSHWSRSKLYVSIHSIYPAHLIETTNMVQKIQFKLQSSIFWVNMPLYIEYSQIKNQILHSFSATVQTFQWWMSVAYSSLSLDRVFRMSTRCSNTQLKSDTKWYNCLNINEFLRQIIPCHQQNSLSAVIVGQLRCVTLIAFQNCTHTWQFIGISVWFIFCYFYIRIPV